jgi:hypothetical protein
MIEVRKITAVEDFLQLAGQWNSLLESTTQAEPYLTHEWFEAWWKAFHPGNHLHVLIALQNGHPLGIAPLMLCEGSFRGLRTQRICFMANGQSPAADFIIPDEHREQVLDSFIGYLLEEKDKWDVLELQKIHSRSPMMLPLRRVLRTRGLSFGLKEALKSPIIRTTGSWESFLQSKSRKFRKVLRNKLNRIERLGDVSVERATGEQEVLQRLEDIFLVSSKSWKHREGTAITDLASLTTFYQEVSRTMGRKGWVELWLMRDGKRPVAFEYHMNFKGVAYPIRADYDEDYRSLCPGSVLEHHILRELFSDPTVRQYNSCGHTYDYLLNWTLELREHLTVQVFNARVFSRLLYGMEYTAIPLLRRIGVKNLVKWAWTKVSKNGSSH